MFDIAFNVVEVFLFRFKSVTFSYNEYSPVYTYCYTYVSTYWLRTDL